jgi:outer membrane PBP1 activator LpoA protein
MSRWIKFLLAILIGIAAGLYFAWVVRPVQIVDTTPDTLRIDYRADYTLMVAEIYGMEQDPAAAARRLGRLGSEPPAQIVQQAIIYAGQAGAAQADLLKLEQLRDALQMWNPDTGAAPGGSAAP